jgi:NitT/TauT family transport system substrate-binding protein
VDLDYVALPIPVFYMEMWGDPSIKSVEDIKGKKIGLSSPGSLGDTSVSAFLEDKGWSEDDVQKTFLKSSPAEVTALNKGAVDAIVTQPPTGTQTREQGFKKITDFTNYPAAANAYTVMSDYHEENQEAVKAFVKSEVECLAMLHNDPETAIKAIQKHSGVEDRALAEYSYNFFEKLWAEKPTVDPELVKQAFAEAAEESGTDAPDDVSKYVDNSVIEDLDKSGFIDDLYSQGS